MKIPLNKWLAYYSPLFRGRFDFFLSTAAPRRETWHQGLAMTGGRFWVRVHGGHNLRRVVGPMADWKPSLSDVLVARGEGRTASLETFPWVGHSANAEYIYALTVVGAGGVEDVSGAPIIVARFDPDGALIGPSPNRINDIRVQAIAGGRFVLRWYYDETGQEVPPGCFNVYSDDGSPGTMDYDVIVATVAYRFRRGHFEWTSAAYSEGDRIAWAVRAESASGVVGPVGATALGIAATALPPAPIGLIVIGAED